MPPTELTKVLARQNRNEASVGNINSLPPDVLLDIFEQYVRPGPIYPQAVDWPSAIPTPNSIEYLSGRGENSPFIIDQVCRTWRQLCRSNSGLYSDIHIVNPTPHDVVRVKTMLELSKGRPLRVFLQDDQCSHPPSTTMAAEQGPVRDQSEKSSGHLISWNRILQLVLATPRIEKLYLKISQKASLHCWRNTWEMRETNWAYVSFPLLTTLHIDMNFENLGNMFIRDLVSRACATSRKLRDMRFDSQFAYFYLTGGDDFGWNGLRPGASMIPWRKLTSLTLCVPYLGKAMTILGQCPLLQTVELYCLSETMFPDSVIAAVNGNMTSLQQQLVREPVVLPFLWSLVLSMSNTVADTFEPLLYLKAPALKSLTLERPVQRQTIPFEMQCEALLGALTIFHRLNPGCRIQTFSNHQQWWAEDVGHQQILSHPIFKDLRSFKTEDVVGEETLEWMAWDRNSNDPPVLPKLRTFSVLTDAKDGVVSKMVASRVVDVPDPVLRTVRVIFAQCLKEVRRKEDNKGRARLTPLLERLGYFLRSHGECTRCGMTGDEIISSCN